MTDRTADSKGQSWATEDWELGTQRGGRAGEVNHSWGIHVSWKREQRTAGCEPNKVTTGTVREKVGIWKGNGRHSAGSYQIFAREESDRSGLASTPRARPVLTQRGRERRGETGKTMAQAELLLPAEGTERTTSSSTLK